MRNFRAPREAALGQRKNVDSVHARAEGGGGGLRLQTRADMVHAKMRTLSTLKNHMGKGHIHIWTSRLLDRINPVGQFSEK